MTAEQYAAEEGLVMFARTGDTLQPGDLVWGHLFNGDIIEMCERVVIFGRIAESFGLFTAYRTSKGVRTYQSDFSYIAMRCPVKGVDE